MVNVLVTGGTVTWRVEFWSQEHVAGTIKDFFFSSAFLALPTELVFLCDQCVALLNFVSYMHFHICLL